MTKRKLILLKTDNCRRVFRHNRNADWVAKMPAIMSDKPTFFAVGAGHLPGEKGVLNLLKLAGYEVEAVK